MRGGEGREASAGGRADERAKERWSDGGGVVQPLAVIIGHHGDAEDGRTDGRTGEAVPRRESVFYVRRLTEPAAELSGSPCLLRRLRRPWNVYLSGGDA